VVAEEFLLLHAMSFRHLLLNYHLSQKLKFIENERFNQSINILLILMCEFKLFLNK
jgi:hypothetical protein